MITISGSLCHFSGTKAVSTMTSGASHEKDPAPREALMMSSPAFSVV
ncbi:MAG TPA: hypothetical protein VJ906_09640 [Roseovarius sp.]|nr:hypothetical protein [Roseovarius sp.]